MRSLEEILKSSGLNTATTKANGGSPPDAIPEPALDEGEQLCPRCGGAGFVRKAVRLGHPDFGKAFACECIANEREDQRFARLQRYSNLGPLARLTFADLSPLGRSPNPSHQEHFSRAVQASRRFAEQPQGWLVLTGPSGCGKTHLASAIGGRCIESGTPLAIGDLDVLELPHLRAMTFKSFDPRIVQVDHREEQADITNAYRQAMKYAEDPKEWLLIAGVTGRGKTRLAAAIGNYCRDIGIAVMMVVAPDLLDWLRVGFSPHNPRSFDELFERVKNVHLLILADLGSQSSTPWADETLCQLLHYHYHASLPTVISTNANAASMEARVRTRLTDPQISSMLLMGGFDFWGKADPATTSFARSRGRPPRRG